MDVCHQHLLGMMPMLSPSLGAAALPMAAAPATAAATTATTGLVRGTTDGPTLTLSNGIRIRCMSFGGTRVTRGELLEAIRGIMQLPAADQLLAARAGIVVELVPAAALENGILGATTISAVPGGAWQPSLVRIAVRSPLSNQGSGRERISEIVQHELGHVQAVIKGQDRSEQAAEHYALMH